jgi:hypothetical protein
MIFEYIPTASNFYISKIIRQRFELKFQTIMVSSLDLR